MPRMANGLSPEKLRELARARTPVVVLGVAGGEPIWSRRSRRTRSPS
jgi:hypothetical protein